MKINVSAAQMLVNILDENETTYFIDHTFDSTQITQTWIWIKEKHLSFYFTDGILTNIVNELIPSEDD
jgi:hypothetical protein